MMKLGRFFAIVCLFTVGACARESDWLVTCPTGCGGQRAVEPPLDEAIWLPNRLYFDLDAAELNANSRETLKWLAAFLQTYPDLAFVLAGHADERGTREYNLALGQRRAEAVKDYLLALGISGDRLTTVSYGKERPAMLGTGEGVWWANRRVEAQCDLKVSPERALRLCRYLGDTPLNHDDGTALTYSIKDGKLVRNPAPHVLRDGKLVRSAP